MRRSPPGGAAPHAGLATLAVGLALGCGGADRSAVRPEVARASLPATDRDPLPYTPPPTEFASAGPTVALAAAGGEEQARRMLPALVRALRDPTETREADVLALFDDEVGMIGRPGDRGRPRAVLVHRMLVIQARRPQIPPDARVEDLFDVDAIQVFRASTFFRDRALPSTVRMTDLVVTVPILAPGAAPMRSIFGWSGRAQLVVRPGREPRIVAY